MRGTYTNGHTEGVVNRPLDEIDGFTKTCADEVLESCSAVHRHGASLQLREIAEGYFGVNIADDGEVSASSMGRSVPVFEGLDPSSACSNACEANSNNMSMVWTIKASIPGICANTLQATKLLMKRSGEAIRPLKHRQIDSVPGTPLAGGAQSYPAAKEQPSN
ncbi:hypothetical protein CPB85DRAFT_1247031 [Mucidula mucida]|nr:hypothetical protein CPB85DRAFT_1247031 [Mucidula mucida]